ncbi:MAG: hypothetical protein JO322_07465 [Candidatus Eremiobacteraeota bacterium]|nr:hypothetical protein [Candidatus Eremiobacteraeota bacterium]
MKLRFAALALIAMFGFATIARADEGPTNTGPMTMSETQFAQQVQQDLTRRYPNASDAVKAGYVRYTSPDDTGAISYANKQWASDQSHPSQLWYDKNGDLLGADFSVLRPNNEPRPQLWGVDPGRWVELNGHVHYVTKDASGAMKYDQWVWNKDFVAAGGSLTSPSADTLVKMGKVKSASDVATIFEFPTIWDLVVWVKPNPYGAFAWENPSSKP